MTLLEKIRQMLFEAILNAVANALLGADPENMPQWMIDAIDAKAAELAATVVVDGNPAP